MSENDSLTQFGDLMEEQTGLKPEDHQGAPQAQQAAEVTFQSAANFATAQLSTPTPRRERERRMSTYIVEPYDLEVMATKVMEYQVPLREDYGIEEKPYLLAALWFAQDLGMDVDDILVRLKSWIEEESKKKPWSSGKISFRDAALFVQENIVQQLAAQKGIRIPQPTPERSEQRINAVEQLARALNPLERNKLARYIASISNSKYSFSPFYLHGNYALQASSREEIRRQNWAIAIAENVDPSTVENFIKQNEIFKEGMLVAFCNPNLSDKFPTATWLLRGYKVTIQEAAGNKRYPSLKEALEEEIRNQYEAEFGDFNYPAPLEELAAHIVVDRLSELNADRVPVDVNGVFSKALQSDDPIETLEQELPDIHFFIEGYYLKDALIGLKKALENPDRIPDLAFWSNLNYQEDSAYGFFSRVIRKLISSLYKTQGGIHLEKWKRVVDAFRRPQTSIEEDVQQTRLTLELFSPNLIGVRGSDGIPLFALRKDEKGTWFPTSFYDKRAGKSYFFGRLGDKDSPPNPPTYRELEQIVSTADFEYTLHPDYIKLVLQQPINELAGKLEGVLRTQVDLEALQEKGYYPSHAAISYVGQGDPLIQRYQYLVGSLMPYSVGIYNSIFHALLRQLYIHSRLNSTEIEVEVPITGEKFSAKNPLFELQTLSWEEIQRRLNEIGEDVRIPEITIRKSGGYELRARGWVYEALIRLKEIGFDAVLGKTMAKEFNRQAARIYVEQALKELKFLPKDYSQETPLSSLRTRQQKLFSKAKDLGFVPQDIPSDCVLGSTLDLPLTWKRERELIVFLQTKMPREELQDFLQGIGVEDLGKYLSVRPLFEEFLDFASEWGWQQFDRSDDYPLVKLRAPASSGSTYHIRFRSLSAGKYAISTQAQERFKAARKTWEEFIEKIKTYSPQTKESLPSLEKIISLGKDIVNELQQMEKADVTEWAKKIIQGEMAAVGRDLKKPIEVTTWQTFYEAVDRLLDTARLVLIYRAKEARFGWEVSTDREELFL